MPDLYREYCRQCRDEGQPPTYADFIIWGKFFPPEALGPRCYLHACEWFVVSRVDQYAVYDLRPVHDAIDALAQVAGRGGKGDLILDSQAWAREATEAWQVIAYLEDENSQLKDANVRLVKESADQWDDGFLYGSGILAEGQSP